MSKMEKVSERVVESCTGKKSSQESRKNINPDVTLPPNHSMIMRLRRQHRQRKNRGREETKRDQAGGVKATTSANVKMPRDETAEGESEVCGDEDAACACWGPGEEREGVDGGVEEDGPADGHESDLSQASEEYSSRP